MTGKMRIEIDQIGRGKLFFDDVDVSKGCTGFDIRCRVGEIATARVYFLTDCGVEGTLAQTDYFKHTTSDREAERRKIAEELAKLADKKDSEMLRELAKSVLDDVRLL